MSRLLAEPALSIEERAMNYTTFRHIERVRNLLNVLVVQFLQPPVMGPPELGPVPGMLRRIADIGVSMGSYPGATVAVLRQCYVEAGADGQLLGIIDKTVDALRGTRHPLSVVAGRLLGLGEAHDQSKLLPPEVSLFTEMTPRLSAVTYQGPEYKEMLKELEPALRHHYANNPHHPEHYLHGVDDMDLFHIGEMCCDWKAASERHHDGNVRHSLEKNQERFAINAPLQRVLAATMEALADA